MMHVTTFALTRRMWAQICEYQEENLNVKPAWDTVHQTTHDRTNGFVVIVHGAVLAQSAVPTV